ncbi:hypothetical protein GCM10018952_75870 [Streptosporangium vulgare]
MDNPASLTPSEEGRGKEEGRGSSLTHHWTRRTGLTRSEEDRPHPEQSPNKPEHARTSPDKGKPAPTPNGEDRPRSLQARKTVSPTPGRAVSPTRAVSLPPNRERRTDQPRRPRMAE